MLFMEEKIFTIEEQYNNQYNKIYAQCPLRFVLRVQEAITLPMYGLVGGGVSHQRVTPLQFCEHGVKTGACVYQEDVLQGVVKPLNTTVFSGQKQIFQ
jgi:hypothetical protein